MRFIEPVRAAVLAALLAGCSSPMPPHAPDRPTPGRIVIASPEPSATRPPGAVAVRPIVEPRTWSEYRLRAAGRLVAANPQGTYTGEVPEPLLAIPVLEIELDRDGGIRRIEVLRHPKQARDTTQLAIDAVRRAAPFGNVSRLPRPWKFTETFLFDDQRRFKPRTLDD